MAVRVPIANNVSCAAIEAVIRIRRIHRFRSSLGDTVTTLAAKADPVARFHPLQAKWYPN